MGEHGRILSELAYTLGEGVLGLRAFILPPICTHP